jgi:hypothetical protein
VWDARDRRMDLRPERTPLPRGVLDAADEFALLDALPMVDTVRVDTVNSKSGSTARTRVICTLWCGSTHPAGDLRQPSVSCNQSNLPEIAHAMRALRLKIVGAHAGYLAAAEAARAACLGAAEAARAATDGPSTRALPDALSTLMANRKAQQAADRAEAAFKASRTRLDGPHRCCGAGGSGAATASGHHLRDACAGGCADSPRLLAGRASPSDHGLGLGLLRVRTSG